MHDLSSILRRRSTDFPPLAGADQPERRSLGVDTVRVGHAQVPVVTQDVAATPFATLLAFARDDGDLRPGILIVPPLSGHFGFLLRDLVAGLVVDFRVLLIDWTNGLGTGSSASMTTSLP
jgi:poly(3-hydroxybutyrate) depolymerase